MTARVLVAYPYFRDTDIDAMCSKLGGDVDVFADSGAFSAMNSGITIELDAYMAWLRKWEHRFTCYANLDVIGDVDATARNADIMHASGLTPLPVFHRGEPWPILETLTRNYDYVGLGGLVRPPTEHSNPLPLLRWLVKAFRIAGSNGCALHGFGITSAPMLRDLPFYSVDSTSHRFGQRWGLVYLWDDQAFRLQDFFVRNREHLRRWRRLLVDHGVSDLNRFLDPEFLRAGTPHVVTDRELVNRLSVRAFQKMEAALQHRHHVAAPSSILHSTPGTKIYLGLGGDSPAELAPHL